MIANINYKGSAPVSRISHLDFGYRKPQQFVQKCEKYTIIIFRTGNCRVMGCKTALSSTEEFPFGITIERIQSITVTENLGLTVNLYKMARSMQRECMFEPELFTALRFEKYNPLCVNIFSTGKVVIMGVKELEFKDQVEKIMMDIKSHMDIQLRQSS
jgi:TATA-box binding protein (TBP) (component of TFIID and TFIIIB)